MSDDPKLPLKLVNREQLARFLNCMPTTLDMWIAEHGEAFPVVRRGSRGVEWQFDPETVRRFLDGVEAARQAERRDREKFVQEFAFDWKASRTASSGLGPSIREQITLAKLRQIERQDQIRSGALLKVSEVRASITNHVTRLRQEMASAVRQGLKDAGVPEAVIRSAESRIAQRQREFVKSVQAQLVAKSSPRQST